jgi:hypothetical protein
MIDTNLISLSKAKKIQSSLLMDRNQIFNPTQSSIKDCLKAFTEPGLGFLSFALNCVSLSHPTKGLIPLSESIYKWQILAAIDYLQYSFTISLKPRQTGNSSFVAAYCIWRSLFYRSQECVVVSLTQRDSSDFLRRVKFAYDNLPNWLKAEMAEDSKTSMSFKNNSRIKALPSGSNIGRGLSASCMILDEFAFVERANQMLAAIIPTISTGLKTENTRTTLSSSLFIISTLPLVDDGNNEYMRILKSAQDNEKDSKFKLIDVTTEDIEVYNDPDWHLQMKQALGEKRYNVEVLCKVNAFAEDTLFSEKVLSSLIPSKPIRTDFLKPNQVDEEGFPLDLSNFIYSNNEYDSDIGYIKNLWVWKDPEHDVEYGISCDVSAGQRGDYSCFHVFNLETYEQVAEYNSNVTSTEIFKQIIWDVTIYYNKAKLSIESNSMGIAIVQWFTETKEYENFYFTRKSKNNYVPGFYVGSNRGNIIASGVTMLETNGVKLNSIRTINQARLFGYTKSGKLEGLNGTNDDLMLSLFQFCYLMEIFFNTSKVSKIDEDEENRNNKSREEQVAKHRLFNQEVYIDRDTKDFLDVMHSQGYSLPKEYLEEYMK